MPKSLPPIDSPSSEQRFQQLVNGARDRRPRLGRAQGEEVGAESRGQLRLLVQLVPRFQSEREGEIGRAQKPFDLVDRQRPEEVWDGEGESGDVAMQARADEEVAGGNERDGVGDRADAGVLESAARSLRDEA